MSKVCAVFNFGSGVVQKSEIEASLALQLRTPDSSLAFWSSGNAGLGAGCYSLKSDPEPPAFIDRSTGSELVIAADAVLTNRAELFKKFGVLLSENENFSDARLILEAYARWGEDCPRHLLGDFAFAIWDEANGKLFCARDHYGLSTFFFFKSEQRFILASEPRGIYCFPGVERKLNLNKLAILLIPEPHTYLTRQSWFKNVIPFPPGTSLTVSSEGLKEVKYWEPKITDRLPPGRDEDIPAAFRDLFFEVIEARLKSDPSTMSLLSGGLDSSAIVAVAAKILEKQNRVLNVLAAVAPEEIRNKYADERFYIDRFRSFPNVRINYVTAPDAGPFSDLEEFFLTYDSPYVTSRHYNYRAFAELAQGMGARTLLDGSFGEIGPTFHGVGGYAEMFRRLKWLSLWRELKQRKRLYDDSIRYMVRSQIISPLMPRALVNMRHGRLTAETPFREHHPFTEGFAQKLLSKGDFTCHENPRMFPDVRKNQFGELLFIQRKMAEMPSTNFGTSPVEYRYPFADKRLTEFSMAVPLRYKLRDGYYRYLIRAALDGILPPEIQWRTSKMPFSPDYSRRYSLQIGDVRMMLADIGPGDPVREIIDIEKISRWAETDLNRTNGGAFEEMISLTYLPQAIYLIHFLRTFPEFR